VTRVRTREWSTSDYYAVLGLDGTATSTQVDIRYRELAKLLHPDRNTDPDDLERFKQVGAAYTVLRDPATRSAYDEFRARVAEGRVYTAPTVSPQAWVGASNHGARARPPRSRPPMPDWLRATISAGLIVLGLAVALWAIAGDLPSPQDADTPVAVQVTLFIMAAKLWAGAVVVARYPQLRARWHR
jgi:DnaJ domain